MSAEATFWAWKQSIKPASAKLVLLCLADCHNGDSGQCNPSIPYIVRMTGLDRKTVMSGIRVLEGLEAIKVFKQRGTSTNYGLATHAKLGSTEKGSSAELGSTTFSGKQFRNRNQGSTDIGTRTYKEPTKNLSSRKQPLSDDFKITEKMRHWASEKVPGLNIEEATEKWADYWRSKGGKFVDWEAAWRNGMKQQLVWQKQRLGNPKREEVIF